jgi:D-alanine-D-alanine ligase
MKRFRIALVYNSLRVGTREAPEDRGGTDDLRAFIRALARRLRELGHTVTVVSLADDMSAFQRRLRRLHPDVIFNQYDDVVHGALYEMRVAALITMMGFPVTGSKALALGLCRYKHMTASLLQGAGIPIPQNTRLLERMGEIDKYKWHFPVIVQPAQEHAGIGLERDSIIHSKRALRNKVRHLLNTYHQPVLAQRFLTGREFNVSIIGGRRMRVLPFAEVDYSGLHKEIPPIMSYAAKWLDNTPEYRDTAVICPATADAKLASQIGNIALRAFRAVGGWGYGRVDIRLDEAGTPRVLEVNCNPSLEEGVALARSASAAGISYRSLLQMIIGAAIERPLFNVDVPML